MASNFENLLTNIYYTDIRDRQLLAWTSIYNIVPGYKPQKSAKTIVIILWDNWLQYHNIKCKPKDLKIYYQFTK